MQRLFVCYFHEIILKRGNRGFFESRLLENTKKALAGLPYSSIQKISSRILVELLPDSPVELIGDRLQRVFGLASCCPAWSTSQEMARLQEDLWSLVSGLDFETFKIDSRRANKKHPHSSQQMNELLGEVVRQRSGKTVRLDGPDLTCYVDIIEDRAFLYFQKLPGSKGLPISSSGRVVALLSGGIDSPVAAYKVMKRGCRVVFVHFHSLPHTSPESLDKVRRLVSILNGYQVTSKIYMIPFAGVQRQIVAFTPAATRVILYRRFMIRLAAAVARRERAKALVTGESIGQVASQTLENIRVIAEVSHLPILRPVVGDDKEEIISVARRIGTFSISTEPHDDCCSLFVPRHPETRARLDRIENVESELDADQLIRDALGEMSVEKVQLADALQEEVVRG